MSLKSLYGETFSALLVPGNESWVSDSFSHATLKILLWAKMNILYSYRAKNLIKILT